MQAELIDGNQINAKIKNFHVVASREQPDYKMYSRDLPFLFDLAILAKDVDLMLELSKSSKYLHIPSMEIDL